jgi:hypothetical protein
MRVVLYGLEVAIAAYYRITPPHRKSQTCERHRTIVAGFPRRYRISAAHHNCNGCAHADCDVNRAGFIRTASEDQNTEVAPRSSQSDSSSQGQRQPRLSLDPHTAVR